MNTYYKILKYLLKFIFLLIFILSRTNADTPGNCTYEDIQGHWIFYIGSSGFNNDIKCAFIDKVQNKYNLKLEYPNIAFDDFGNQGSWTMIYNQGFEVVIHGRKFFAFSKFDSVKSYCSWTMIGWSHNLLGHDWACFFGVKNLTFKPINHVNDNYSQKNLINLINMPYIQDIDFINKINKHQSMWRAKYTERFHDITWGEYLNMRGGLKSINLKTHKSTQLINRKKYTIKYPTEFDWRNVSGINYISPIRDQGACGSCYAFASMAMIEARLRKLSNNNLKPILSPQYVVDCNPYSQGCDGGFPYLVAGKFAEDFGLIEEQYYPYKAQTNNCALNSSLLKKITLQDRNVTFPRYYATDYMYIGGYYGASNEELMMEELVRAGPIAVGFEVYDDFMHYSGGIYKHTGLITKFNPFELTNHAVLIVGFGTDEISGQDFWIVKNSWGAQWGEGGYFRILRGVDECGIESLAAISTPIF